MADLKHSNLDKVMLLLGAAQTKFQHDSLGVEKDQLKTEQEIAGEDDDKREVQLDELIKTTKNIERLVSRSGAGKGKEGQLDRVSKAANPLSITTVGGESAGNILKSAVEHLSKDLETWSNEEKDSMKDLVKEIANLSQKNIEEWNKGIKKVLEAAKKGQEQAAVSGNKDAEKAFGDARKTAMAEHFKQNKMDLTGKHDTFANRLGRQFNLKDENGNAKIFNKDSSSKFQSAKAIGTAVRQGLGQAIKTGAKQAIFGSKENPGKRYDLFTSDAQKRADESERLGVAPQINSLSDLTKDQKKMLADKGIAPSSDKDISYRKEGKPVSKEEINKHLEDHFNEKNKATAELANSNSSNVSGSELQEEQSGMSESPSVKALEDQTKVLHDISETSKETKALIAEIKKAVEKLSETSDTGPEGSSDTGSSGGSILDNVVDIADDLGGGSSEPHSKKTKSERAKSQPRDAKGRFVKKEAGELAHAKPKGRLGKVGKGLLGGLALAGTAIGLGSMADNDNEESGGDTASTVANTASTASDLADMVPSKDAAKAGEKEAVKVGEKGAVKAGEKAAVKAGEKVGGKLLAKEGAKVGAKALGKSILKKIPGVGILAGGAFAAQRAMQGDWLGAGGELLSGVAGTIPGVGTAASAAIDAGLAARDMGAFGGAPGEAAPEAAAAPAAAPAAKAPVQGKTGGGIMSKVTGFAKKHPFLTGAMGLGGVGLAAAGASKAWDWMTGSDEPKVESGGNQTSTGIEHGSEAARDKMNVNVPPPTVINQGGNAGGGGKDSIPPAMPTYTRDDENSWMRFALKRAMA